MARYSDWKPKKKDLDEYNALLGEAEEAIYEAYKILTDDYGWSPDTASSVLPELPTRQFTDLEELHDEFTNRNEFNLVKNSVGRIVKASEGKARKDTANLDGDTNQLLAFYTDEYGNITESQYQRRETSIQRSAENQRKMNRLKESGIEFERIEVTDPETGRPMYDENRHKITVAVPKTPEQEAKYRDILQQQPELAVTNIGAEGGVIQRWGDEVQAPFTRKRTRTMEQLAKSVRYESKDVEGISNYFDNYKMVMDVTMPEAVSDEIGMYIDRINEMTPSERQELYRELRNDPDVAGTIEFMYQDISMTMPTKMMRIINYWRTVVAPKIDMEVPSDVSIGAIPEIVEEAGYLPNQFKTIAGEFNRKRSDISEKERAKRSKRGPRRH